MDFIFGANTDEDKVDTNKNVYVEHPMVLTFTEIAF